jgi:hypothetical protein
MKRIANVGDVIEYIFKGMPILASVGLVDKEAKQYGVHVTSEYSFRCANIAQDYVYFDQVIAVYKKIIGVSQQESTPREFWTSKKNQPLTDWRNLC